MSAGVDHTCAIVGDGEVFCWGDNTFGQVGSGHLGGVVMDVQRVALPGDAKASRIVAGPQQTCAVTVDGQVLCWGAIAWTGLVRYGEGTCVDIEEPTGTPTLITCIASEGPALDVELHGFGICAPIQRDQVQVFCLPRVQTPKLESGYALERFALGDGVLCVVTETGEVLCTGTGAIVGRGPDESGDSLQIQLPAPAVDVAMGFEHACAWSADGHAWCWGDNSAGQIPSATEASTVPPTSPVALEGKITLMVAGSRHTCAVPVNGSSVVRCWGDGPQAGPGDEGSYSEMTLPSEVAVLSSMADHSCALDARDVIWCWGANPDGRLGANQRLDSATPRAVLVPNPETRAP